MIFCRRHDFIVGVVNGYKLLSVLGHLISKKKVIKRMNGVRKLLLF